MNVQRQTSFVPWVLFLGPQSGDDRSLASARDASARAGISRFVVGGPHDAAGAGANAAGTGAPLAVVIGVDMPRPLSAAREAHRDWSDSSIVFMADAQRQHELAGQLLFAPMIGANWQFVAFPSAETVTLLASSFDRASRRVHSRRVLDGLNLRLAAKPTIDPEEHRRLYVSDRYLASILANVRDAIFSTDDRGLVTTWNRAAATMFRLGSELAVGRQASTLIPQFETLMTQVSGQEGLRAELVCRRAAQQPFEAEVSLSRLDAPNGSALGFTAIVRDITERKAGERERENLLADERAARAETERLYRVSERMHRMKDEFLANLSHELRTPLNAILGFAALMREDAADLAEEHREALDAIYRNGQAQASLVEDLLDVARVITGKLTLDVEPIDLAALVRAAAASLAFAAQAKGISFLVESSPETIPIVGDRTRLQQVVWNLLANAVKFTPKYGKVTARTSRSGSLATIEVVDTGIGIEPDFLPFVFDRFRQEDATSKRSHGGLGLGLAIVRHLVEMHGGSVTASSAGRAQGAAFIVALPVQPVPSRIESVPPPNPAPTPASIATQLLGVRVLVVDDEADARALLRRVLTKAGARVTAVGTVAEARRAEATAAFDALVSDLGMPGEDGLALILQLRAAERAQARSAIPALAVTAYASSDDRERALTSGFDRYLTKPIEARVLVAAIRDLVDAGSSRSDS